MSMTKEMQDYKNRVIEEKKELDERIKKLNVFMKSKDYEKIIGPHERIRLERQLYVMMEYSSILGSRIDNF